MHLFTQRCRGLLYPRSAVSLPCVEASSHGPQLFWGLSLSPDLTPHGQLEASVDDSTKAALSMHCSQ